MKTNGEIRKEARGIMRGRWFWRILVSGGILYFISLAISGLILASYSDMGIQTWADFLQAKIQALQAGLGYTVPSVRVFWQMTGASVFQQFIAYVFGAILLFGMAGVLLKAVRDDERGWLAGAFGGFRRPLELAWLLVLMNFLVCLWGLLLVIPGIVAIYRYRQAWYLKNEHPDWSAWKCLGESSKLMRGHKGQAFALDASFVGWLLLIWIVLFGLVAVAAFAAKGGALLGSFVGALGGIAFCYFLAYVLIYFVAARAIFYRELACAPACDLV